MSAPPLNPTDVFNEENLDGSLDLNPFRLEDPVERLRLVLLQEFTDGDHCPPDEALEQANGVIQNLEYYNIRIS